MREFPDVRSIQPLGSSEGIDTLPRRARSDLRRPCQRRGCSNRVETSACRPIPGGRTSDPSRQARLGAAECRVAPPRTDPGGIATGTRGPVQRVRPRLGVGRRRAANYAGDLYDDPYQGDAVAGGLGAWQHVELCCRAPLLMHEHAWFLKTSIFPSETLAWTAVLRALSYAGISFGVLLVFELALDGLPPLSILLLPFFLVPLVLFLLGMVWFLAAIGAFTRDISYLMITFVPLVMFATPVFYRVTDLPDALRVLAYANPLGTAIEIARAAMLDGVWPPTIACFGFLVLSLAVCRGGHAVFERYKGILVDVI